MIPGMKFDPETSQVKIDLNRTEPSKFGETIELSILIKNAGFVPKFIYPVLISSLYQKKLEERRSKEEELLASMTKPEEFTSTGFNVSSISLDNLGLLQIEF
jgi:hypothetical protein